MLRNSLDATEPLLLQHMKQMRYQTQSQLRHPPGRTVQIRTILSSMITRGEELEQR
jgi:hypothetical protein